MSTRGYSKPLSHHRKLLIVKLPLASFVCRRASFSSCCCHPFFQRLEPAYSKNNFDAICCNVLCVILHLHRLAVVRLDGYHNLWYPSTLTTADVNHMSCIILERPDIMTACVLVSDTSSFLAAQLMSSTSHVVILSHDCICPSVCGTRIVCSNNKCYRHFVFFSKLLIFAVLKWWLLQQRE